MSLKWNEVTWYSKLLAVIVFLFGIPALAFYIGMQYGITVTQLNNVHDYLKSQNIPVVK